jgi:hypothetical protein
VSRDAAAADLAAALSADLAARLRACPESVAIDDGWVIRNPSLGAVHQLNAIVLGTSAALNPAAYDADAIDALARRWQAELPHRCLEIDDERAAERLAAGLAERGWERQRTLFMALRSDPSASLRDVRGRGLSEEELGLLQLACLRQEVVGPSVSDTLPALLADAQAMLRTTTPSPGIWRRATGCRARLELHAVPGRGRRRPAGRHRGGGRDAARASTTRPGPGGGVAGAAHGR